MLSYISGSLRQAVDTVPCAACRLLISPFLSISVGHGFVSTGCHSVGWGEVVLKRHGRLLHRWTATPCYDHVHLRSTWETTALIIDLKAKDVHLRTTLNTTLVARLHSLRFLHVCMLIG